MKPTTNWPNDGSPLMHVGLHCGAPLHLYFSRICEGLCVATYEFMEVRKYRSSSILRHWHQICVNVFCVAVSWSCFNSVDVKF